MAKKTIFFSIVILLLLLTGNNNAQDKYPLYLYGGQSFTVNKSDTVWVLSHNQFLNALKMAKELENTHATLKLLRSRNLKVDSLVNLRDQQFREQLNYTDHEIFKILQEKESQISMIKEKSRNDIENLQTRLVNTQAKFINSLSGNQTEIQPSGGISKEIIIAVIGSITTIIAAIIGYFAAKRK